MVEAGEDGAKARHDAIGDISGDARSAFSTLSGSGIHDLYGFRALLGVPDAVASTELWNGGRGITTILEYPNEVRLVYTWAAIPGLWDFKETLGGLRRYQTRDCQIPHRIFARHPFYGHSA